MRKLGSCIILLFCILLEGNFVYANDSKKAFYTDITAYINDVAIPCYEVDGKVAIIAEDLENYGFDVNYNFQSTWQGKKPVLEITYQRKNISLKASENAEENNISLQNRKYSIYYGKEITVNYNPEQNKKTPGSFAFYLYPTNLSTTIYSSRNEIPCYNIGGKTMIFMDSLKMPDSYFTNANENNTDVLYYPEGKKVCFRYTPSWSICLVDGNDGNYRNEKVTVSRLLFAFNKNEQGNFDIINENMEYLDCHMDLEYDKELELSIDFVYDYELPQNQVNYQFPSFGSMVTNSADGVFERENTDFANEHLKLYINGKKLTINEVSRVPGNNHILYTFSFHEKMDNFEEIKTLKLICE